MTDRYDRLYAQLEELIPDLRTLKPGDYRKSEAPGFMDLHLDALRRSDEELIIALAHNNRHPSGDTIPNPDMEIRVYLIPDWKKAEAMTYQDTHGYHAVYPEPGKVNLSLKKMLNRFLKQWLHNLANQGHSLAPSPLATLDNIDNDHDDEGHDRGHAAAAATAQLEDIETSPTHEDRGLDLRYERET